MSTNGTAADIDICVLCVHYCCCICRMWIVYVYYGMFNVRMSERAVNKKKIEAHHSPQREGEMEERVSGAEHYGGYWLGVFIFYVVRLICVSVCVYAKEHNVIVHKNLAIL